jgi:hypothetical protein
VQAGGLGQPLLRKARGEPPPTDDAAEGGREVCHDRDGTGLVGPGLQKIYCNPRSVVAAAAAVPPARAAGPEEVTR